MKYVIADIHGNERRFNSILKQINLQSEDTLYVLGDVIDRYPGGIRILRRIMSMPNVEMLLGNHEYMMLRALGHPYDPYDTTSEVHLSRGMRKIYLLRFIRIPKCMQRNLESGKCISYPPI